MSYQLDELKDFLRFRRMLHMNVDIMKRIIPVIIAYLRPRFTSKFTRSPANTTPKKFAEASRLLRFPLTTAHLEFQSIYKE
ncbi:hypothetical protein Pyn_09063 [Prunus yedoensis var. nudiflora]|uniref:Uncharacterized protein n=1 Tax=Prunus yedoensis var. nudiflora TaxID=2094558 RepID=A0A314XSV4_PRUYE|nr:hypothetical protein Pyn_09063 [Prunus yedoensis var. nudiflora]